MLTVRRQQHSFSRQERMFLWKCQSFWNRKCCDLRATRTPILRGICICIYMYLSNRSQSVNYNDYESDLKTIKCGVPHGSVLGSLLFLIYINDLSSVSKYFMPILFADDTNLFCTGPNLHDIVCQINQEIKIVYSWVKANKLSLHIDKTNFMLHTPKRFSRVMDVQLMDGKRITEVNETKLLGVIIDKKLNWKPHIR